MNFRPIEWISSSLSRKYAAGTTAGLVTVSVVFLVLFMGMYRQELEHERSTAALQVNRLLQTSLEAAMLRRDLDMLRSIIHQLGQQQDIRGVDIINRVGFIRFSHDPSRVDIPAKLNCDDCQFNPQTTTEAFSFFTTNDDGAPVLRTVHPVHNREPCKECHGPASEHPINGTLVVDYEASVIQNQAKRTTLLLMGSGALVVFVTLTGGWWFMRRFVLKPLNHLSRTSQELANEKLDARVQIHGRDEIALLGRHFNHMANSLQMSLDEIRNKEKFLQSLVDANPDGLRVIGDDYRIVLANQAYCDTLGVSRDQIVGEYCYRSSHHRTSPCVPTLVTCPLEELKQSRTAIKTLQEHFTDDGQAVAVEVYAAPMTLGPDTRMAVVESIRDLNKAIQISHEQKLSEIGQLAAGVAHEIHNPLASVRLALDAAIRSDVIEHPDVPPKLKSCISLVDREINRCIEVTERLLKMSMFAGGQMQVVDLNKAIDDTLSLVRMEALQGGIETKLELSPETPRILANESDIRIVILNLTQNAFHAMPAGGLLTITTRRENGQVEMTVDDTGVGIRPDDLPRIFNPFFSRRADDTQGTGLGLPISRNLVERYKGLIQVQSTLHIGSHFALIFPDPDFAAENPS